MSSLDFVSPEEFIARQKRILDDKKSLEKLNATEEDVIYKQKYVIDKRKAFIFIKLRDGLICDKYLKQLFSSSDIIKGEDGMFYEIGPSDYVVIINNMIYLRTELYYKYKTVCDWVVQMAYTPENVIHIGSNVVNIKGFGFYCEDYHKKFKLEYSNYLTSKYDYLKQKKSYNLNFNFI